MNRNDGKFHVRIGHFVPDAPTVDFLVDGYPVLTDRDFGEINDYTEHEAADYHVSVQQVDDETTVVEEPVGFEAGQFYTLLLVGTMAAPELRLLRDGRRST